MAGNLAAYWNTLEFVTLLCHLILIILQWQRTAGFAFFISSVLDVFVSRIHFKSVQNKRMS